MDRGRPRESERCSLTCTCTIQEEVGVAVVRIGFGGHSEHTRRQHVVLWLTLYVLSTVCRCESPRKVKELFLVCESRANQEVAQARPIDALHLTSIVKG